jgi:hypothetical protein
MYLHIGMNESVVLYESSDYVPVSGNKANSFYNNMRMGISDIVGELDEMWANVKNVEPQGEYRHVFRLKPFEDFINEETVKRAPKTQQTITVQANRRPRSNPETPKFRAPPKPLVNPTPRLTQRAPLAASKDHKVENRKPISAVLSKPQPKQLKWIRVEDLYVPL